MKIKKFKKRNTQDSITIDGQMIKTTKIKDVPCTTIERDQQPSTINRGQKITSQLKNAEKEVACKVQTLLLGSQELQLEHIRRSIRHQICLELGRTKQQSIQVTTIYR
jgi:hypothetical protein